MEPSPDKLPPLEQWRPYLRTLARMQIETKFQAKIDASTSCNRRCSKHTAG